MVAAVMAPMPVSLRSTAAGEDLTSAVRDLCVGGQVRVSGADGACEAACFGACGGDRDGVGACAPTRRWWRWWCGWGGGVHRRAGRWCVAVRWARWWWLCAGCWVARGRWWGSAWLHVRPGRSRGCAESVGCCGAAQSGRWVRRRWGSDLPRVRRSAGAVGSGSTTRYPASVHARANFAP